MDPLRIHFRSGTTLARERDRPSLLPVVRNGPPGTFVVFPEGFRVSLPTDQIIAADDAEGFVSVAFGGMAFVAVEAGQLICRRVREMLPEERLSPDRSHRMQLDPGWVTSVLAYGRQVWPDTTVS